MIAARSFSERATICYLEEPVIFSSQVQPVSTFSVKTMQTFINEKLQGGLWHTTNPERLETILKDGFIKVEPNLLDSDGWGTARGPAYYPFVLYIGGVSLFEFPPDFDVAAYEKEIPTASLGQFIPFRPSGIR